MTAILAALALLILPPTERAVVRETAENLVVECMKVADKLKEIHDKAGRLLEQYGWDLEVWEVAEAGMQVGILGLGIAHSIGCEDGWADEEVAK